MSKSKKKTSKAAVSAAISNAGLGTSSQGILVENLNTLTTLGAQGVSPDDLVEDRVTLFVPVIDRSGSRAHEAQLMRDEYNSMLDALNKSKARETILVSSWLFDTNCDVLHGFVSLDDAERLDSSNYDPDNMTSMYDALLNALTSTVAYATSLLDQGYRVKIVVVLITDGEDNSSSTPPNDVRTVVEDLLQQEIYVMAMVAFGTGYAQSAAQAMGFISSNVIEYGNDAKDIRSAFQLVSSSTIRQSQTQIGGSKNFFT